MINTIKLNVSDIQHFSTGDGPGIRTTVFLKGCNLHCPWCHNPETISAETQKLIYREANKVCVVGRQMTVSDILSDIMEDEDFYRASNGGVTLSGGEPLLQSAGVEAVVQELKKNNIPTVIDTAGGVPWDNFLRVKAVTDTFFFDFKSASREVYEKIIGGDFALIYGNLCRLIAEGSDVHVRVPLIPDINTSEGSSEEICRMLTDAGVKQVDLLPFHRMGSGKYEALGLNYKYKNTVPLSKDQINNIADIYRNYFQLTIEQ